MPIASRVSMFSEFIEVAHRLGGIHGAQELARKRAGRQFDPALAAIVEREPEAILSGLDAVATWDAVIEAEPALAVVLSGDRFDDALLAVANFVDLKSPYTLGHARAVAELAAAAGDKLDGPGPMSGRSPRRSVSRPRAPRHLELDLGQAGPPGHRRVGAGAPASVSDRADAAASPRLWRRSARSRSQHRERLDGSGYPRGLAGAAISRPAGSSASPMPTRPCANRGHTATLAPPAMPPIELRADSRAGRLDPRGGRCGAERCRASSGTAARGPVGVDRARGRGSPPTRSRPDQQADCDAARDLAQNGRTSRRAHLRQDRCSSRAQASLFAMRQGLLPEEQIAVGGGPGRSSVGHASSV